MKTFELMIFMALTSFLACQDSPVFTEVGPVYGPIYKGAPSNYGTIFAEKNGVPFVGNIRYLNHDNYCEGCYSLNMYTFEDSLYLVDFLNISNLHISKLGNYDMIPDDPTNNFNGQGIGDGKKTEVSYFTRIETGDVEGDTYELYEGLPNWLEIQSVDTVSGLIRGSFEMHFEKVIENDIRNPKYVRFSNAEFEAKIE